ncbi:hypothetical protein VTK56DRAFT_5692 [Thermocarpiscus australiensis]
MLTDEVPFPIELASPFTPQKSASNSPAPSSSQPNQPKSKHTGGNKSRPKQVTSPGPPRQGRTTPPQTVPKPTAAPAAFAGATFHASPAPSSLPIPSFLAKALDSPGLRDTDRIHREPSPPATDSEAPTPQNRLLPPDDSREESPLDIFFRADRAEKERARRASCANILSSSPGPLSAPAQIQPFSHAQSPLGLKSFTGRYGAARRPGFYRDASNGISASELDGTPGGPIGPAFSTPYHDRIRAARSEKQTNPGEKTAPPPEQASVDQSEKLKRFLAIGGQRPEMASMSSSPATGLPLSSGPCMASPSSTASATRMPDTDRPPEILHMEDSLRRMLKIDAGLAGLNLGAAPPANYQSPGE